MKKTILALSAVVALSTSAFAYGMGGCQGGQTGMSQGMMMQGGGMQKSMMRHGGSMGMQMVQNLNLSDDQRYKLSILHSEMKLEMAKLHDPKMMNKMQDFMSGESFNKKEFIKFTSENQAKMNTLKADHMEKVFNLLTKEQRTELKEMMAKRPMQKMTKKS